MGSCIHWRLYPGLEAWVEGLGQEFAFRVREVVRLQGRCLVLLAGGQTPVPLYERLVGCPDLPWENIHWWLGDERWVDLSDERSNERVVRRTLGQEKRFLSMFHSWHLACDPIEASQRYAAELVGLAGEPPVFDQVLLGMGVDGHVASLFPGDPLLEEVRQYTGVARRAPDGLLRVTVTLPVLVHARCLWLLVRGQGKRKTLDRLAAGDPLLPVSRLLSNRTFVQWCWT
ncbi:6-phosphogluconolactonase [Candidatus Methylacidithermus pantelleriae]|uniref:6-phosphogluconolactonase n=1 Tax=Candidatus Methylacidithermus pantelleriae TaxID=2744239 RepID=A0A8J2BSH0_9BACT|nr:6-phosphogluconolactonase [Candidatus Methylacidithermus pantelleriae]CAF0696386.1 6-phosphogluconolactonase [Candidatus Methylacidithermus pantelleriae]